MMHQQNQIAIVTGIAGAIGNAIAKKLKEDGYKIFGIDCVECNLFDDDAFYKMDLEDFARNTNQQLEVLNVVKKHFPNSNVKLIVNNAAYQFVSSKHPIPHDAMDRSYHVNVLAPYYLITLFADELTLSKGSVVNISSIHTKLTKKGFTAYATSKAALSSLTRSLALEFEDRFRINCIEPASIDTHMLREGLDFDSQKLNNLSTYHPQKRIGTPQEVAELVSFLATENAKFLHGSCIDMSGGISSVLHDPA